MSLLIAQVLLQAAILCGLLYLIARHEADYSFGKVAMVVAGLTLGEVLIDAMARERLGHWVALIHIPFIAFMIMTFCWVNWWKSLIVIVVYIAVRYALAFAAAALIGTVMGKDQSHGMATLGASESELAELAAEIEHNANLGAEQLGAMDPPEPPAEPAAEPATEPAAANAINAATQPAAPTAPEPDPIVALPGENEWSTARRTLQFGATASSGNQRMVYINGQHREVGDIVSTVYAGTRYRWRVKSIADDRITLSPLDKHATAPDLLGQ